MSRKLEKLLPPGYSCRAELCYYFVGMALASGFSLKGWYSYAAAYHQLRTGSNNWEIVLEGQYMEPFASVFQSCFPGFGVLAVSMVIWVYMHYASFWKGSKSIYLMRRLPNRAELHCRCISVPVLEMVGAAAVMVILAAVYYVVYLLVTPDVYLQQGQVFWDVFK